MGEVSKETAAIQAAREQAVLDGAIALLARRFGVSFEIGARAWGDLSRRGREEYLAKSRAVFEAAEAAMERAGLEWRS